MKRCTEPTVPPGPAWKCNRCGETNAPDSLKCDECGYDRDHVCDDDCRSNGCRSPYDAPLESRSEEAFHEARLTVHVVPNERRGCDAFALLDGDVVGASAIGVSKSVAEAKAGELCKFESAYTGPAQVFDYAD